MSKFTNYEAEARQRWGSTGAYQQYAAKNYTNQQQKELAEGMDRIMARFALCMAEGNTPDSAEAQALVKQLQSYITEHYYLCTKEILLGLGQMYTADERFRNNIDRHASGTADFICQAIQTYCGK